MFTNNKFGKLDAVADAIKSIAEADYKTKMEELKGQQHKIDKNKNNKIDSDDFKILRGEKKAMKEEDSLEEATMTHITLGNKVKNSDGGHNQDVHYKGKKIGHIESYKHRSGLRYGSKHDASGEQEAGSRSPEEAISFVRTAHAEHLKTMKNESLEEGNNPFDLKNYKSQLPTKPGEKAGFDSKKVSTGTVYSRKPVKDEPMKKEEVVVEGSGSKEKQKTPYRDINSPEYRAAVEKQKQRMAKDKAAEPGKKMLKKEEVEQVDELSKDTLKSYSTKAKASAKSHRDAGNQYDSDPDERAFAPNQYKKAASRTAGAAKADSRIKEEAEQVEAEALIENVEIINEVSLGAKIKAYAQHSSDAFEHGDMGNDDEAEHHEKRADKILAHIEKHHGAEAVKHAQKAAHSEIFGRGGHSRGSDSLSGGLRSNLQTTVTKAGKIPKNTQSAIVNRRKTYGSRVAGPKGSLPEEVEMNERELSKGETSEKERIVKGMKKSLKGFKARYGDKAKSVMYATATARAKKD